jgi:hypothetical protein
LTSIGDYAFYGCSGITKVVIPSTVTYLGGQSFKGTSTTEVVFNTNQISNSGGLGSGWYEGLAVETITIKVQPSDTSQNFRVENNGLILANVKTLKLTGNPKNGLLMMAVQSIPSVETLILDEGITAIGMYSLTNLKNLKTLVVKADVSSFPCNKMSTFTNMTSLENLYANDAVYTGITTQANGGMTVTNHYTVAQWTGM